MATECSACTVTDTSLNGYGQMLGPIVISRIKKNKYQCFADLLIVCRMHELF